MDDSRRVFGWGFVSMKIASRTISARPHTGVEGVEVMPFPGTFRVHVSQEVPAPLTERGEREWTRMCGLNPQLFDGPILSVNSIDAQGGMIRARRERYARLAVGTGFEAGVRLLAVTAVCIVRDGRGAPLVFFGRRGPQVRVYPGMWELGPSGGLDAPEGVEAHDESAVYTHLQREAKEEAGITLGHGSCVAIARDHFAQSDDLVYVCDGGDLPVSIQQSTTSWEYSDRAWVPVALIAEWLGVHGLRTIGTTKATLAALGWA